MDAMSDSFLVMEHYRVAVTWVWISLVDLTGMDHSRVTLTRAGISLDSDSYPGKDNSRGTLILGCLGKIGRAHV